MITGHKPNGYIRIYNEFGRGAEGETRQCVHCQYFWSYAPGSGTERGYCTRHNGFTCEREVCRRKQRERIAALGDWPFECISFEDFNQYRFEKLLKNIGYQVNSAGIFVPVEKL